ncbi:glycosyltransferase family 39 protein [Flavobacterium rakeshii]|uniref:glycosyltransferase family 39 protein n=1 Tax=Flavobacterium rakeshii TaxID=1038845 RepID=UPI002E7C2B8F|nr:glycosyltransferase family 39 protein [Flavobacterium rakeshii]MEE1897296.1 glycosyltransferase family 39 protein [Flavobacterium rakeshii]
MKKITAYIQQNYWLLIILLLASILRLFHVDYQSIWIDEIHTMIESDPSMTFREMNHIILLREGIGHMYFLIVKGLNAIFGYSTLTARLFSAFTGIASIYAIYLLGKELFNKRTGLIAALLLTVNLYHITYSQEARSYILLVLFCTLAFYKLAVFLKRPSVKNAIWYGVFAALMFHAHIVSALTLFGQVLLILFILYTQPKEERKAFFKKCVVAGTTLFLLLLPGYSLILKVSKYKSGWLTLPGPDGFSKIVKAITGDTELLWFLFLLLTIFYFVNLFKQKDNSLLAHSLLSNNIIFSALIFFCWIFFAIPLSIIKSYMDEPMILSRYFIHMLPALALLFAIAIEQMRNRISQVLIVAMIVILSLTDIFIVKDYYYKLSKSQYRELTTEIMNNNPQGDKVVSSWGWLMSYFFKPTGEPVLEMKLRDYVNAMKEGTEQEVSFWYLDGNSRPYDLTQEEEAFLNENFTVSENIELYDTWARHYILKSAPKISVIMQGKEKDNFKHKNFYMFENGELTSESFKLEKGQYNLIIKANSLPKDPIKGEHAHLQVKIGNEKIGDYYLNGNESNNEMKLAFEINNNAETEARFIFDNDTFAEGKDRNLVIYSVQIEKKE